MDTVIVAIGVLSGLGTLAYLGVYFASLWKAHPRVFLRFADEESIKTNVYGVKGLILFGVSTRHKQDIELREICIPVPTDQQVRILPTDLFKAIPWGDKVAYCWTGNQIIRNKTFILFRLSYEVLSTAANKEIQLEIILKASLCEQSWGFPWSLFSLLPKAIHHTRTLSWHQEVPGNQIRLFRLDPMEAAESFGEFAKKSFSIHGDEGRDFRVKVSEIYEDHSYSVTEINGKFQKTTDGAGRESSSK